MVNFITDCWRLHFVITEDRQIDRKIDRYIDRQIDRYKDIMQGNLIAFAYTHSAYILKPVLSGRNL